MISRTTVWPWCLLLAAGCVTKHPFDPVALEPLSPGSAQGVYQKVCASAPTRFTILTSVVFEYRGRSMTAMGLTRVDTEANTFSVIAMSPLGAKLFELRGDGSGIEAVFVAEELREKADPSGRIGKDIRTVYLNPLPGPTAESRMEECKALFQEKVANGRIEYLFGGAPPVLVEKRLSDERGIVWRVTYHEHVEQHGKLYPGGIVMHHRRYGYRLVIRLKQVIDQGQEENIVEERQ